MTERDELYTNYLHVVDAYDGALATITSLRTAVAERDAWLNAACDLIDRYAAKFGPLSTLQDTAEALAQRARITHRELPNHEWQTFVDGEPFNIYPTAGQGERAALAWLNKAQIDAYAVGAFGTEYQDIAA